ncbi:hypothetical protein C8R47DRAFT_1064386 [Mycena vitilis]|nr:hypothetical protein C8R47DRAFT_1064386 [Mycena vitilis]
MICASQLLSLDGGGVSSLPSTSIRNIGPLNVIIASLPFSIFFPFPSPKFVPYAITRTVRTRILSIPIALPFITFVSELEKHPLYPAFERIAELVRAAIHPCGLDDYLAIRCALRLSCPLMQLAVDSQPLFWTRYVFTPRTPATILNVVRMRSGNLPLDITVRISAASGLPSETDPSWEGLVEVFMSKAKIALTTAFQSCRELTVEAVSIPALELMLQSLSSVPTKELRAFEIVYPDQLATDVIPAVVSDFIFDDCNELAFPPFTTFTIAAVRLPLTLASHLSADICSASVRQPVNTPLPWDRFCRLIGASNALDTLILHGIEFEAVPDTVVGSIPLPNLTTLDVRFRGCRSMGLALLRLNLPRFHTLVFRCDTVGDVSCFSSSLAVFAVRAQTFRLVTSKGCFISGRFRNIFALFHRATTLDLRAASFTAFKSFLAASTATYPNMGTKWKGCPALTHLHVPCIPMPRLIELVHNRRASGFQDFHVLTGYLNPALVDVGHLDWFFTHAPGIALRLCDI